MRNFLIAVAALASAVACGPSPTSFDAGSGGGSAAAGGGLAAVGGGTGGGGGTVGDAGTGGGAAAVPHFAANVAPIFKAHCAGCHNFEYGMTASAYTRLRGIADDDVCSGTPRLVVNDGANSLVVQKMLGTATCGVRMPMVFGSGCTGTDCVAAADIETVKVWIDLGAMND